MRLAPSIYRAGKRLVGLFPAWLIRFRPFVVYEIPLSVGTRPDSIGGNKSAPSGVVVRWLTDATELAALPPLASRECLDDWDGDTRRVAIAELDGRAIGCAWVATGAFAECELGLLVELAPDEAWLYAASVDPALRNRGVYRRLLEFVAEELRSAGTRRLLLGVTIGNEPSRRAHARQGAVEIGRVIVLRVLGITLCRAKGRVGRRPWRPGDGRGLVRLAAATVL
jgi:GNAT superfamily N-acetyltransferase